MAKPPTEYRDPDSVSCPTCKAEAHTPCWYLNGSGPMSRGWHKAREQIEFEEDHRD